MSQNFAELFVGFLRNIQKSGDSTLGIYGLEGEEIAHLISMTEQYIQSHLNHVRFLNGTVRRNPYESHSPCGLAFTPVDGPDAFPRMARRGSDSSTTSVGSPGNVIREGHKPSARTTVMTSPARDEKQKTQNAIALTKLAENLLQQVETQSNRVRSNRICCFFGDGAQKSANMDACVAAVRKGLATYIENHLKKEEFENTPLYKETFLNGMRMASWSDNTSSGELKERHTKEWKLHDCLTDRRISSCRSRSSDINKIRSSKHIQDWIKQAIAAPPALTASSPLLGEVQSAGFSRSNSSIQ
ncbi:hypothetical protein BH10PSE19_BH10PSE19_19240 [soil metagenome]